MADRLPSYRAFWPYYLGEHARPATRAVHYVGTGLFLIGAAAAAAGSWWPLAGGVVAAYALAWLSHLFIERNRPATFTHPLWSLVSDFRMFGLFVAGRLGAELERHGIAAPRR